MEQPFCRVLGSVRGLSYDGDIMMSRSQITLDSEIQRRARRRAGDMGLSFAEYVRRLVSRDLGNAPLISNVKGVFDLGASNGSDIATNKDEMLADSFAERHRKRRKK
jgi:hypothetical protein